MPQMNGLERMGKLRELKPDVKILGVTGYVPTKQQKHDDNTLQKPFTTQRLLFKVKKRSTRIERPSRYSRATPSRMLSRIPWN
jgi:two-component SAPR family response regulator